MFITLRENNFVMATLKYMAMLKGIVRRAILNLQISAQWQQTQCKMQTDRKTETTDFETSFFFFYLLLLSIGIGIVTLCVS